MNKRGILALLMAVMMLIISVPASAATIYIPAEVEVTLPEEGATMTSDQLYRALKPSVPGSVIDFQFYDNDAFGAKLATIGNGIIGATISAHVVYNGADEAAVKEWDLTMFRLRAILRRLKAHAWVLRWITSLHIPAEKLHQPLISEQLLQAVILQTKKRLSMCSQMLF